MNRATTSIVPWFTHPRMIPKWIGLLVTGALAFAFPARLAWLSFVLGVVAFFPSEYVMHRGVFHYFANKPAGKVLSKNHVAHHVQPDDLDFIFNDPRISVSVGVLYFLVALAITRSWGLAGAFSFGNYAALLYYEHVHFLAHRPGSRPIAPWSKFLKKMHLWHHYKNEHYWFGVTSPAFDYVFKSMRDPKQVDPSPTVHTLVPSEEQQDWMRQ